MRKFVFFFLSVSWIAIVQAQTGKYVDHERRVPASPISSLVIPSRAVDKLTTSWPSYPELVGYSVYDMQSNDDQLLAGGIMKYSSGII